jgi:hypothetical protein
MQTAGGGAKRLWMLAFMASPPSWDDEELEPLHKCVVAEFDRRHREVPVHSESIAQHVAISLSTNTLHPHLYRSRRAIADAAQWIEAATEHEPLMTLWLVCSTLLKAHAELRAPVVVRAVAPVQSKNGGTKVSRQGELFVTLPRVTVDRAIQAAMRRELPARLDRRCSCTHHHAYSRRGEPWIAGGWAHFKRETLSLYRTHGYNVPDDDDDET